jgi:hypothetical protein
MENGREAVIGITKLVAEREEEKLAAATQYRRLSNTVFKRISVLACIRAPGRQNVD